MRAAGVAVKGLRTRTRLDGEDGAGVRVGRVRTIVLWGAGAAMVAALGWGAGRATLAPPAVDLPDAEAVTYTVDKGRVERGFDFGATAEWQVVRRATNAASGTVTGVLVRPGSSVRSGDVLYRVDERPVFVASGAVPQYRDLSAGDVGQDVRQLQQLLTDRGYLSSAPSGTFGTATESGVRAWQRASGVRETGVVPRGDLLFVERLPARVRLAESITVGAQLSPGAEAVHVLAASPRFTMTLSDEQLDSVPSNARVRVSTGGQTWKAQVASLQAGEPGETTLVLRGARGGDVCGAQCDRYIGTDGPQRLRATVVVVPRTSGPMVPAAAIQSDVNGGLFVTDTSGEQRPVEVLAADGGQAIVDGLEIGTEILLFGQAEAQSG